MCLLVFMPEGITATKEALESASYYNDDGFGWAIRTPDKILVGKSMDFTKAYEEFSDARSCYNGDALFHLRITTNGETNLDNCHPFYVGKDSLSVVAHNGILPVAVPAGDNRSDTRIFAETLFPKRGGIAFLNGVASIPLLEKWAAGSKLVFLTSNPASKWRFLIANEKDGDWGTGENAGVWFSNNSYKYGKPLTTTTKYVGGWDYSRMYSPATYSEGVSIKPVGTTKYTLQDELDLELQHHAYEIAETLLSIDQKNAIDNCWDDDPTIAGGFYDVAEELIVRWTKIYKAYNEHTYSGMCARCGNEFYLDHDDIPATHCPSCDTCLYCGSEPSEPDTGLSPADCCGWPMGYFMSYEPSTVQLVKEGGDKNDKGTPSFF